MLFRCAHTHKKNEYTLVIKSKDTFLKNSGAPISGRSQSIVTRMKLCVYWHLHLYTSLINSLHFQRTSGPQTPFVTINPVPQTLHPLPPALHQSVSARWSEQCRVFLFIYFNELTPLRQQHLYVPTLHICYFPPTLVMQLKRVFQRQFSCEDCHESRVSHDTSSDPSVRVCIRVRIQVCIRVCIMPSETSALYMKGHRLTLAELSSLTSGGGMRLQSFSGPHQRVKGGLAVCWYELEPEHANLVIVEERVDSLNLEVRSYKMCTCVALFYKPDTGEARASCIVCASLLRVSLLQ